MNIQVHGKCLATTTGTDDPNRYCTIELPIDEKELLEAVYVYRDKKENSMWLNILVDFANQFLPKQQEVCQYKGCTKNKDIGEYCWEHDPYCGMHDPAEEEKRKKHYGYPPYDKPKLPEKITPLFMIDKPSNIELEMAIISMRDKINQILDYLNKEGEK